MSHVIIGKDNYSQMIYNGDSFLTVEKNGENFYLTSALDAGKEGQLLQLEEVGTYSCPVVKTS